MRIAFVTNTCEPIIGGVAVSVKTFHDSLKAMGHDVFIIAPNFPNYQDTNPNIFRMPSMKTDYRFEYPLPLPCKTTMLNTLRYLKVDLIHSHQPFWLGESALELAKDSLNVPTVFTYHTNYEEYLHYIPISKLFDLRPLLFHRISKYLNNCDAVITPTHAVANSLMRRFSIKDIQVLQTGVSEAFSSGPNSPFRTKPCPKFDGGNIRSNDEICLCVSRLSKEKNCDFMLDAFFEVIKQRRTAKILIVGGGHMQKTLQKTVYERGYPDRIIFVGDVPHARISYYYSIAKILLFVSRTETQGLPLTESLGFGLPIVAIESEASNELVSGLNTGIVVKQDKLIFANTVADLLDERGRLNYFNENNRSVSNSFKSADMAKKLLQVYESVLSN